MKLLLITCPPLAPYLERMLPQIPHQSEICLLPEDLCQNPTAVRDKLAGAKGCDAAVLLPGACVVPEEGLRAGEIPLVLPRVHNSVSLLLGSAAAYRRLYSFYDGKLCWSLPESNRELFLSCPAAECQALCYLADTTLGLHDTSLSARIIAQHNDWDFFHAEGDLSLLSRLLAGDWLGEDILLVRPGETVSPTSRQDLLA